MKDFDKDDDDKKKKEEEKSKKVSSSLWSYAMPTRPISSPQKSSSDFKLLLIAVFFWVFSPGKK